MKDRSPSQTNTHPPPPMAPALGLAASAPLLLRLRHRFNNWWAPAIGLAVFTAMFSLSAFVIGPAVNSDGGAPHGSTPSTGIDHSGHH